MSWNNEIHFLRSIEHTLRVLAWQQTKDGQSKNPKHTPKPILAKWEEDAKKLVKTDGYKTAAEVDLVSILNAPRKDITIESDIIKETDL